MSTTIPGQLLAAIKARKFTAVSKLFSPGVDFQAWTPAGTWVASDGATIAKIIEVWYTPGAGSTIIDIAKFFRRSQKRFELFNRLGQFRREFRRPCVSRSGGQQGRASGIYAQEESTCQKPMLVQKPIEWSHHLFSRNAERLTDPERFPILFAGLKAS